MRGMQSQTVPITLLVAGLQGVCCALVCIQIAAGQVTIPIGGNRPNSAQQVPYYSGYSQGGSKPPPQGVQRAAGAIAPPQPNTRVRQAAAYLPAMKTNAPQPPQDRSAAEPDSDGIARAGRRRVGRRQRCPTNG